MLNELRKSGFEVLPLHHAAAILTVDMKEALVDLRDALANVQIPVQELVYGGGGEGELTQRLRRDLVSRGWKKHRFEIKKIVDGVERESISHEIDHVKKFTRGVFALEIEWNNKDPFFDRDLENFKRLHADGVISIGGIITRGPSLHAGLRDAIAEYARRNDINSIDGISRFYTPTPRQVLNVAKSVEKFGDFAKGWAHVFVSDKFGEATTHWRKLKDRVDRGVGNPCPLLLIGLPVTVLTY